MRKLILTTFLSVAAFPASLLSQGWIVPRCDVRTRPCPATPSIIRTRSDVSVRLDPNGRVLHYEVDERFVNRGVGLGEADYLFPLPKGAAFQDLKLSIDGELVAGETMNATEARRIYEEIVRRQRDPALVEWMGHGLLRARIFPINPGEEKRVVVRFDAVAEREGDALRVDYFRGAAPRATPVPMPRVEPLRGVEPDSRSSSGGERASFVLTWRDDATIGTPYSPTHALDVDDRGRERRAEVRGDARDVTILFPLRRANAASISALAYAPGNEDGFALVTLSPPTTRESDATPRDITFVVDVSGSMSGRKMEQARAAGKQLLETLRPRDRFRIIDFSSDVRSFRDEPVFATRENLRDAARYLDALEASGSTNISGALAEALRRPSRRDLGRDDGRDGRDGRRDADRLGIVLFVTDGEPTVGERNPEAIAAQAARSRGDQRVFTFGLGSDVNVALLERLALEGRGTAQFVRPDESVERMVGVVASRLVDPVLTDVRVRVEGGVRLSRILPQQPVDLFAGQDLVLLARYSGDGDAMLVFEGRRRGERVTWASRVRFPERERDNAFVARLWATQRVGYLSAEKRRGGGSSEIDDEIRSLGERFGIPTEFTSYLVQEPRAQVAMRDAASGSGRGVAGGVASGVAKGSVGSAPAAAPAARARNEAFDQAKVAAEQRAATNLTALEAVTVTSANAATTRQIDGRTFELRDGVWTDVRYRAGMTQLKVKPYSTTYFDLVDRLPELKAVFALGDRVVVVGRTGAIRLDDRAPEPSAAEVEKVARGW
jgi:Ca-activated chloride channel family protein